MMPGDAEWSIAASEYADTIAEYRDLEVIALATWADVDRLDYSVLDDDPFA